MGNITGYRELDADTVELINVIKEHANNLGAAMDVLTADPAIDQRWLAIARTDLQKGMMFLIRAIARPSGF